MAETEPEAKSRGAKVSVRALTALFIVALAAYGADQLTKFLVVRDLTLGDQVPVIGELLHFVFVKNSGAAFSLASGSTWVFSIAAAAVAIFIVVFAHRIRSLGWAFMFGMLLGGTIGNLTDRLFREPSFGMGHVVDFIQVWGFPAIFNVADIFIVSSMGLFVILSVRGIRLDGTRELSRATKAAEQLAAQQAAADDDAAPFGDVPASIHPRSQPSSQPSSRTSSRHSNKPSSSSESEPSSETASAAGITPAPEAKPETR